METIRGIMMVEDQQSEGFYDSTPAIRIGSLLIGEPVPKKRIFGDLPGYQADRWQPSWKMVPAEVTLEELPDDGGYSATVMFSSKPNVEKNVWVDSFRGKTREGVMKRVILERHFVEGR